MPIIYLLTGGNIGNRLLQLQKARRYVARRIGKVLRVSQVYETGAWGKTNQVAFLNQVLEVQTQLPPPDVLQQITYIENKLGRVRTEKWGERSIDIDILLYGNEIISTERLNIPHLLLPERRFALVPLTELAGSFIHPVLHVSVGQLLQQCTDTLAVNIYRSPPTSDIML